ncbi:hypothetical protein [Lutimonas sp.]|uniref:hypothetical protein n=1 Tax=Lutimonas sp. TaxID=1872403 RepID=UPI003C73CC68
MSFNKKHKIAIAIVLSLALILLSGSVIISRIISQKVVQILEDQNVENLHVSIEKTKFSLFDRSLVFNGVHISPNDSAMLKLQNNKLDKKSLHKISISRLKFKGIHLMPLLFSKHLNINKLIIDDPLYQHFTNDEKDTSKGAKKPLKLDSIRIEELKGFQLDIIKVTNLKVQVIDAINKDISFENKPLDFEVSGFKLEEIAAYYFKLVPVEDVFEMTRIKVEFPKIKYLFSIDALKYHFGEDHLQISNLKYKPTVNKLTLANSYIYNTDVYDLDIKEIKLYAIDFEKILSNKGLFIDSIQLSQLNMEIYKDKRKPFDLNKRPKLPHQKLKTLKMPFLIHKISANDSELIYEEKLEHKDVLMKVTMKDLNINMFNITSVKEYRNTPLKIDLNTQLMGKANLNVDLLLPLADDQNTFFFSGYLGPSKMTSFDSAAIPALGLNVLNGQIENISFQGSANNFTSKGSMKMLYHDLEAEVFKKKTAEKNDFLSWSVKNLVHKSNPGNNGEVREATMKFERVMYKGFGNFLWKTLQNGIVNSIAPFGMTTEKVAAKKKRQSKRENRKKNRKD